MRPVVLVLPPAIERAASIWEMITPSAAIVCADYEQAVQWADAAPAKYRAHAVTGLARTAALIKEGRIGLLAGAPVDLAALVSRAAVKLEAIDAIVIAWPEGFANELDTLLAEAPDARRIVLSWNPPALTDFLERHARRADVIGNLPLDVEGRPLGPVAAARYVVTTPTRHAAAVREVLDVLRPAHPYVWNGGPIDAPPGSDVAIAIVLPTREELHALAAATSSSPVVLARAVQLPFLRSIASLAPVALPAIVDRAQDRGAALRAAIAARVATGVDAELGLLAPLFEEYDPAVVAAALLALSRREPASNSEPVAAPQENGWTRLFVSVGKKDHAAAKDLVGALIKEAGLQKGQIGKIEVRETFSLVDVAPAAADQAVRRLTGVSIRGRRIAARPDRG